MSADETLRDLVGKSAAALARWAQWKHVVMAAAQPGDVVTNCSIDVSITVDVPLADAGPGVVRAIYDDGSLRAFRVTRRSLLRASDSEGWVHASDIAGSINRNKQAACLAHLVRLGLVERDGRLSLYRPTPAGIERARE